MLGHAFFPTKKTNKTKQTKTKLNINRDIKEHNNNTRIYQYHGLGPLQRPKYPKSELFWEVPGPPLAPLVTFKSGHWLVLYQFRCPMAPRFVFGPLSPTQGPKSPKKWLFERKSESGAESESDIRENSFAQSSHMDLGEGLSKESFNHVRCGSSTAHAWKNPPNSPHPFSIQNLIHMPSLKKNSKNFLQFFQPNTTNNQYTSAQNLSQSFNRA